MLQKPSFSPFRTREDRREIEHIHGVCGPTCNLKRSKSVSLQRWGVVFRISIRGARAVLRNGRARDGFRVLETEGSVMLKCIPGAILRGVGTVSRAKEKT